MTAKATLQPEISVRRSFFLQPFLVCIAVFCVAFGGMAYVVHFSASQLDEDAAQSARRSFQTALKTLEEDLNGRLYDYAWWDEAVEQAAAGIDQDWADRNIGAYMQTDFDHSGTFVLDAGNLTIFADNADDTLPDTALAFLGDGGAAFLAEVQTQPMSSSEPIVTYVKIGDRIFLASAAPITPEYPTGEQLLPANRPIMIYHRELDAALLKKIEERYSLESLALRSHSFSDITHPIASRDGRVLSWAAWMHPGPGSELINRMLPILFTATAILVLAIAAVYSLWMRAALAANKAKSRFLAKMTHEFRTPLNPILGFSEIMKDEVIGPIPARYREYANDIHSSARHLQSLIEDVLDISKIESGTVQLSDDIVPLDRLIDEISTLSMPAPGGEERADGQNGVTLNREIEPGLPSLRADELRLRQILINLLSNAIKFSNGKDVTIRAGLSEGSIKIEVEDQGIGIAADDVQRVFEPFAQSHESSTVHRIGGTGLGLGIARELMRLHGGVLDLSSQIGVGTLVTLVFPQNRTVAD